MERRTTSNDHVTQATIEFFEKLGLTEVMKECFNAWHVKEKVLDMYQEFLRATKDAEDEAPEEHADLIKELLGKVRMTEDAFVEAAFEVFRRNFGEIMMPVAAFIPVEEQLKELLEKKENETLLILAESSAEELVDEKMTYFANLANLCMNGIPVELAEELNEIGDGKAIIIPVGVSIEHCDCEDDDEDDDHCCGECGGRCNCEGKE